MKTKTKILMFLIAAPSQFININIEQPEIVISGGATWTTPSYYSTLNTNPIYSGVFLAKKQEV